MMLSFLVFPATLYLLITAICITTRMTRHTRMRTRLTVIGLGGIGMWSLERILNCQWAVNTQNISMALVLVFMAVLMWKKYPRVRT